MELYIKNNQNITHDSQREIQIRQTISQKNGERGDRTDEIN